MRFTHSLLIGLATGITTFSYCQNIQTNQVGFFPKSTKKVTIVNPQANDKLLIINKNTNRVVSELNIPNSTTYEHSGELVSTVELPQLVQPGQYDIELKKGKQQTTVIVSQHWLTPLTKATIKSFYYQRASIQLPEAYAGKWKRTAGHSDDQVYVHSSAATSSRPEGTIISSPKGWYDAGDYNKYIVNSGISCYSILAAYEDFGAYFDTIQVNIPESQNDIPDVLDELLWNLRWMLTMQDEDGGVYHKLTHANFSGFVMPEQATKKRYVVKKSTAATLDFAAVLAQSSRVFQAFETQLPGFSDSCLNAAIKAYDWAEENPNILYQQKSMNTEFNPAIKTGEYGDKKVDDEFFWAACELYITTQNKKYINKEYLETSNFDVPGWPSVGTLGLMSLYRHLNVSNKGYPKYLIKEKLLSLIEKTYQLPADNPYQTVMGTKKNDFHWGSNSIAGNQAMVLFMGYQLTKSKKYLEACIGNLDYILGRNATGFCFVTGFGNKSPMHVHHRQSGSDTILEPVPGLLAGGPGRDALNDCGVDTYNTTFPALSYTDSQCSYSTNEIAINWQAPLLYLSAAIDQHYNK